MTAAAADRWLTTTRWVVGVAFSVLSAVALGLWLGYRLVLPGEVTADEALREIFEESCAPGAVGMGQREIEAYLQKCGVDSVPTQKIVDIMAKYPTTTGANGSGSSYLSLEGFLAYYRDTAQSNEIRVGSVV